MQEKMNLPQLRRQIDFHSIRQRQQTVSPKALQQLNGKCFHLKHGWWSYEYCHGKFLRQYHIHNGKETVSYVLGYHVTGKSDPQTFTANPAKSKSRAHDSIISLKLVEGSICHNRPRDAIVRFECSLGKSSVLDQVDETQTCSYLATVQTPVVCEDDSPAGEDTETEVWRSLFGSAPLSNSAKNHVCENRIYRPSFFQAIGFDPKSQPPRVSVHEPPSMPASEPSEQCHNSPQHISVGPLTVDVGVGSFSLTHTNGEFVAIRNLGYSVIEISESWNLQLASVTLNNKGQVHSFHIRTFLQQVSEFTGSDSGDSTFAKEYVSSLAEFSQTLVSGVIVATGQEGLEQIFLRGHVVSLDAMWDGCSVASPEIRDRARGHVIFVHRGKCSFSEKSRQAQGAGAVGIIIGNTQLPTAPVESSSSDPQQQPPLDMLVDSETEKKMLETVFMMDGDGLTPDVMIPALMLSRSDSTHLLGSIKRGEEKGTLRVEFVRRRLVVDQPQLSTNRETFAEQTQSTEPSMSPSLDEQYQPRHGQEECISNNPESQAGNAPPMSQQQHHNQLAARGTPQDFVVTAVGGWQVKVLQVGHVFTLSLSEVVPQWQPQQ
eukprot:c12210_g1_i1.p1 GENE.c12210_g1_i1~~c12210_g1_i1.p1  ORF type:complete len:601 (+),score=113.60 c12210_g1_i1:635-2437(+)